MTHSTQEASPDLPARVRAMIGMQVGFLILILVILILVASGMGYISAPAPDVARIVVSRLFGYLSLAADIDPIVTAAIADVRLPRILTAAIVGGGLSISGAVFQAILLNPLADPYTLGVSAGAAFGASLALLLNFSLLGIWSVPMCAFTGAMLTLAVVLYLSSYAGGLSSTSLILSGIITASILSAGISLIKYLANEQVSMIIFWLMGSFASRTWADVWLVLITVLFGMFVMLFWARDMNLLILGERTAASLGIHPQRVICILLITASLVTAVCVSISGIIGFVGLLVPHMVRTITGPDNRRLIPVACLTGAILLLIADTVTRAVLPNEIPIGVITALTGGPFFCYVLRKRQFSQAGWK
ncbi:MAG: FecCD family ABC transporter permease [Desulfatirhabdiaceae bacterium]